MKEIDDNFYIEYSVVGNDIEEHFEDKSRADAFYESLSAEEKKDVQYFSKEWIYNGETWGEGEVVIFKNKEK